MNEQVLNHAPAVPGELVVVLYFISAWAIIYLALRVIFLIIQRRAAFKENQGPHPIERALKKKRAKAKPYFLNVYTTAKQSAEVIKYETIK